MAPNISNARIPKFREFARVSEDLRESDSVAKCHRSPFEPSQMYDLAPGESLLPSPASRRSRRPTTPKARAPQRSLSLCPHAPTRLSKFQRRSRTSIQAPRFSAFSSTPRGCLKHSPTAPGNSCPKESGAVFFGPGPSHSPQSNQAFIWTQLLTASLPHDRLVLLLHGSATPPLSSALSDARAHQKGTAAFSDSISFAESQGTSRSSLLRGFALC